MRTRTWWTPAGGALALTLLAGCMQGPGAGAAPGGAWGMGPGMMRGGGPGMMMGHGPGGGPGAMWGLERLDLSADQRARIAQIQDEAWRQHEGWMTAMHAQDGPMARVMGGTSLDDAAAREAYRQMSALHQQMFEAHLQTRRRILEVLTPAQREQLGRAWDGPRGPR